jgi:hypothetical protein
MFTIIAIAVIIILIYVVYTQTNTNKNVRRYGEVEDFLKFVIIHLKVTNPNHRKLIATKDQLKYVFITVDGEMTVEFLYLPKKVGVTVIFKTHFFHRKLRASSDYNEILIENCCRDLISKIK